MEEAGHALDNKLNTVDTMGDEGEMFRRILAGENLSAAQMTEIRNENDKGVIHVNGREVQVEFFFKKIGKFFKKVGNGIAGAAKGVFNGVKNVAKGVFNGVKNVAGRVFDGVKRGVVIAESIFPNRRHKDGRGINTLTGADQVAPYGGSAFHDISVWIQPA